MDILTNCSLYGLLFFISLFQLQDNSQPAVVPYSALPSTPSRYQPVNPHVSVQPTTTFHGPQVRIIQMAPKFDMQSTVYRVLNS